jgi:hypothetical protein
MNITDYKKKYLKYKAKYLNIKGGTPPGGTPQSKPNKMNIDKAKAAVRNINFLITAFLPKNIIGEFNMKNHFSERQNQWVYEDIVTPHTFEYYRINSFLI